MDVQVSVIIPIFNSEAFLDICLESVASQKFTDWECLLIDDGSTDSSGEIIGLISTEDILEELVGEIYDEEESAKPGGADHE